MLEEVLGMVDGVDAEIVGEKVSMHESWTACLDFKHSRRVFPATDTCAQAPLDLIHTDICWPISPPAHDGSRYFVTLYDDATRLSVAQPIKNKDESFAVLTRTLKYLERQSGRKVRRIRSDNGGEFVSRKMEEWFADNGIAHELAPPYTPQMNGRAERLNRTLLEKLRTVLRASGMGKQLWNEALLAVNHARNRTAVDDLTCTPWQAFFGRRPDVSHLNVFGAKCIVLDTQAEKLDPQGKAGRIVGYGTRPHVYRVQLNEGIVVSTNVRVVSENGDPMQTTMGQVDCEDEDQDIPLDDEEASTESSIATVESGGVPAPSTPQDDSLGIVRNRVRGWQTETPSAFIKSTRSGRDIRMPTRYRADLCFLTQLVIDPDMLASKEAISARHRELETIKRFKTWEPTQVMEKREAEKIPGALFVRVKFVHALKNSELDGQAEWKARLVAQGCVLRDATGRNVKDELEFPYVAPASLLAVKSNLVLARALDHDAGIFDFEAAYLGARLTGPPIFLILPREAWDLDWATLNQPVVPCLKALYGLPASGSVYQVDAMRKMSARGWNAMETEMNTFYREINGHKLSLTLYVADGIVTGPRKEICDVLDELRSDFSITKPVCFINAATKEVPARFLGMNLFLENNKLMLENSTYAKLILARYVEYCFSTKPRKVTTPTVDTETIKKLIDEGAASGGETAPCTGWQGEAIGRLLWLARTSRPDISYAVHRLATFTDKRDEEADARLRRILAYLYYHVESVLCLEGNLRDGTPDLLLFTDSDCAGCLRTRKSTGGWCVFLLGRLVDWNTKRQGRAAASSTEAELVALHAGTTRGLLPCASIVRSFFGKQPSSSTFIDNEAARSAVKRGYSTALRHLERHDGARLAVLNEIYDDIDGSGLYFTPSASNIADILTKDVSTDIFRRARKVFKVGVGVRGNAGIRQPTPTQEAQFQVARFRITRFRIAQFPVGTMSIKGRVERTADARSKRDRGRGFWLKI
ncbi:Retrovirus-related Pol polyprotein from transposon TNT 1-94 [Porphyridium purpureum]|uniref:Retrovirus-related Pol polyprotein from transposon TNT 1-94 n=1 Tax=Porphyridium purpureum TaxID=35688 RepID=A0A5J4YMY0_PORPP|nr:Retrovirus-related Pol polyprotein from transposon TNT 1-94 [Porphyridium purpureum]|eukprot:POR8312..scf249_10